MDTNLRNSPRKRTWKTAATLPRAKAIAFLLILIVPGGFVVPACYAVYHAIRQSLTK